MVTTMEAFSSPLLKPKLKDETPYRLVDFSDICIKAIARPQVRMKCPIWDRSTDHILVCVYMCANMVVSSG